jgi:hypothetical protein
VYGSISGQYPCTDFSFVFYFGLSWQIFETSNFGRLSHSFPAYLMIIFDLHMLYSVIQKEKSIFREVILPIIVRKKVHMNMCLILKGCRDRATKISVPKSVRLLFVGLDEE